MPFSFVVHGYMKGGGIAPPPKKKYLKNPELSNVEEKGN